MDRKAWIFDADRLDEPWFYRAYIFYAESRNKAKSKAMKLNDTNCLNIHDSEGRPITYLTVPLKRAKGLDLIEWEGAVMTRQELNRLKNTTPYGQQKKSMGL